MASSVERDQLCINTIRTLAMDAVQAANSGHPGTPMALAPVVHQLFQHTLRYDPADPIWPNRDRFVLSVGHASMLLYGILHLTGVKAVSPSYQVLDKLAVPLDDIERFRQWDSRCPGHPEYRWTSGVECTTGPLGQGVAMSVGMAIASRWLAARYNKPGFTLFDFDTYALAGDGCMMEGLSSEAASLAAHLGLSNLCWIYDNNRITIEGKTSLAFSEDVATRFVGHGWNVTRVGDANDLTMLARAFATFKKTSDRPTLIIVDSHIGYGAPNKQDTHGAHGEPLGEEEIRLTKRNYGWPEQEKFRVPAEVRPAYAEGIGARGKTLREAWRGLYEAYGREFPALAAELEAIQGRELPVGWDAALPEFKAGEKVAGRVASGLVQNAIAERIPWMLGGSADLAPSTKTKLTFATAGELQANTPGGRNMHFGVREHAMAAVMNGLSLAKLRPFGSGFLVFSDYARPAIRLAALMELPVVHVFTHDSISVGEDGPTHQPVEHLAALRAIPGLFVIRPADATEVVDAWRVITKLRHAPVALLLTRQAVKTIDRERYRPADVARGAYIVAGAEDPEVLLCASGSEVALCLEAHEALTQRGVRSSVVSMPCWELFEQQDASYREQVFPPTLRARVAVEQATAFGWERYTGLDGEIIAMRSFGASAPAEELQRRFGFTVERVVDAALAQRARQQGAR